MASIDKTYLETREEAMEFFTWYDNPKTKVQMNEELGHIIRLYGEYQDYFKGVERPLWNTSTIEDTYLIRNCPVSFVQERLKEVYGSEFYDFILSIDESSYTPFHSIWKIERLGNVFYGFSEMSSKKDMSIRLDRIMVIGSTYFHEYLEDALSALSQGHKNGFKISFTFFGESCLFDNGTIRRYNKDTEEYDRVLDFGVYRGDIKLPKIKHTFKMSDTRGYNTDGIILSGVKEFHAASDYKGHNMKDLWRYVISVVPKYIYKVIRK